jgi:hypothetical protein
LNDGAVEASLTLTLDDATGRVLAVSTSPAPARAGTTPDSKTRFAGDAGLSPTNVLSLLSAERRDATPAFSARAVAVVVRDHVAAWDETQERARAAGARAHPLGRQICVATGRLSDLALAITRSNPHGNSVLVIEEVLPAPCKAAAIDCVATHVDRDLERGLQPVGFADLPAEGLARLLLGEG